MGLPTRSKWGHQDFLNESKQTIAATKTHYFFQKPRNSMEIRCVKVRVSFSLKNSSHLSALMCMEEISQLYSMVGRCEFKHRSYVYEAERSDFMYDSESKTQS